MDRSSKYYRNHQKDSTESKEFCGKQKGHSSGAHYVHKVHKSIKWDFHKSLQSKTGTEFFFLSLRLVSIIQISMFQAQLYLFYWKITNCTCSEAKHTISHQIQPSHI